MQTDTTPSAPKPGLEAPQASSFRAWSDAVASQTAQRLTGALSSAAARLRAFDSTLAELAAQDWSARGVARRVDSAARNARQSLERDATAALERADQVPVVVMEHLLRRSRSVVDAVTAAMDRGASRLASRANGEHASGRARPAA